MLQTIITQIRCVKMVLRYMLNKNQYAVLQWVPFCCTTIHYSKHRQRHNKNTVSWSQYELTNDDIMKYNNEEGVEVVDCTDDEVAKLLTEKNIVALWQGQSENGPRALGNRSLLFDPKDGKDYVNRVKRREYSIICWIHIT